MAALPEAPFTAFRAEYQELSGLLQDTSIYDDPEKAAKISRRHKKLEHILAVYDELTQLKQHRQDYQEITAANEDADLVQLAQEELPTIEKRIPTLEEELDEFLLPRDPDEAKNAILEIRAGTGGDEAELFAAELFRMYSRYAEEKGWKIEITSLNRSELGGIKEFIAEVTGEDVFKYLEFESGVHRVQR